MKRWTCILSMMLLSVTVLGCGQGGPARIPLKGSVKTADGKPVDAGTLTFAPLTTDANASSAPVSTEIKSDGTFEVPGGIVAGKQKVIFEPKQIPFVGEWDGKGAPPKPPVNPYAGMRPKQPEIEVAGTGEVAIELTSGT